MRTRRLLYLTVLTGCLVFYAMYREWFSWFVLVGVLCLPVLSLMLSLPAMLTVQVHLQVPERVQLGTPVSLRVRTVCRFPVLSVWGRVRVRNCLTGQTESLSTGSQLPAEHCGVLTVESLRLWVSDYLGLLRLPVRKTRECRVYVEPVPVPVDMLPAVRRGNVRRWQPKPGGGFAEQHDLRLYRPGDSLRLIHWKMAAKTGKLIYREPVVPGEHGVTLLLSLCGTPEELDEKLGKLLWLSRHLLDRQLGHTLRCYTDAGVRSFSIEEYKALDAALREILQCPAARELPLPEGENAPWQYWIGGGTDAS